MTLTYWPAKKEIENCIRSEAEELPDAMVMAVHEPMTLTKTDDNQISETSTEEDLLEHVKAIPRPIAIVGQSGFGKSHLIRWLDLELQKEKNKNWHIVRIPKDTTPAQGLEMLLPMDGSFDEVREKIKTVREKRQPKQIAEHLVVEINQVLDRKYKENIKIRNSLRGQDQGDYDENALKRIQTYCAIADPEKGLQKLLSDVEFKPRLTNEGKCFYQVAKHNLTGQNSDERDADSLKVSAADFDVTLDFNSHNCSSPAREFIHNSRLAAEPKQQERIAEIVNECLREAEQLMLQDQLAFSAGNFSELFVEIRKHLLKEEKTLFILIEDMTSISSIQDVLLDNLLKEGVRDGKKIYCDIHSVIASTPGFDGFAHRRDTLRTRSGYEWEIDRSSSDETRTLERAINFCGRYLNAARHGMDALEGKYRNNESLGVTWHSGDEGEKEIITSFGESSDGYPLFPYNKHALELLLARHCKSGVTLEYNPRRRLKQVLREPLFYIDRYTEGEFPPGNFAQIAPPPMTLQTSLREKLSDDEYGRALSFAAVWGSGTTKLEELAHQVDSAIPREFNLPALAELLEQTAPEAPKTPPGVISIPPSGTSPPTGGGVTPSPVPGPDPAVSELIDKWFSSRIPQNAANDIRKALYEALENREKELSTWYGMKGGWLQSLKTGPRYLIEIPISGNNPDRCKLVLGTEEEFKDPEESLQYKNFFLAVIRRAKQPKDQQETWAYADGPSDYCNYSNFIDGWLPDAVEKLTEAYRKDKQKFLTDSESLDTQIDPQSDDEMLSQLVKHKDDMKDISCDTGLDEWDKRIEGFLETRHDFQERWLNVFSTGTRYAVEGDLLKKARAASQNLPEDEQDSGIKREIARFSRLAVKIRTEVREQYSYLSMLSGCKNSEDFSKLMRELSELVVFLHENNQWRDMERGSGAPSYKIKINAFIEKDNWSAIKSALDLYQTSDLEPTIKALHTFDKEVVDGLGQIMTTWESYYQTNHPRMVRENRDSGDDQRIELVKVLKDLIDKFSQRITGANGL